MQTITLGPIGFAEKEGEPPYMASDFQKELATVDPTQDLFLDFHSEGGSVVEGYRMQQLLSEYPGRIIGRVRCMAHSIASYLLMECDEIEIAENGFVMVHNPYSAMEGNAKEMAKQSSFLAELQENMVAKYTQKTGLSGEEVQSLLDEETYIGAKQAIELGFADRIIGESPVSRAPQPLAYREQIKNMPSLVLAAMRSHDDGDTEPATRPEENTVTATAKPVATVADIERAFPKASEKFIVRCMRKAMAMDEVGEEYARAMEEENTDLMARVTAMEAEIAEMRAMNQPSAMDDEVAMDDPTAMDDDAVALNNPGEELGGGAKARRRGLAPVAGVGARASAKDPRDEWNSLVESFKAKGMSGAKAVVAANRAAPKLRQAMVNAVN